jgi:hypothetical protein
MNCPRLLIPPEHHSFRSSLATPPCPHWHRAPLPDSSTRNTSPTARVAIAGSPFRRTVRSPRHTRHSRSRHSLVRDFRFAPRRYHTVRCTRDGCNQSCAIAYRRVASPAWPSARRKRLYRRGSPLPARLVRGADSGPHRTHPRTTNARSHHLMISLRELKPTQQTWRRALEPQPWLERSRRDRRGFDDGVGDECDREAWVLLRPRRRPPR